ncbi:Calcium-dependent protein kinase 18 [Raphanus sativus]|nr:Calcium-dependent protein kinase 18 [Raphanus sativus]
MSTIAPKVLETTIDDDELDDLIDQFDVIDIDKKDFISLVEMRQLRFFKHQLEEHDSDQWEQRSRAAFENFYMAKDGFITPEEPKLKLTLMKIGESASMSFADS